MYSYLSEEVLPRLIPANTSIFTAVSGGPDSVALAHLLRRYIQDRPEQNLTMVITHVNHKVRPEADQEAQLVKKLARELDVPFILHEFKAREYAEENRKCFQEAAREWRYARWKKDMVEYGCDLLATAHHLGDQAETVLYRLIRGSGTAGLAGIYPVKDKIIRPLLKISKSEILSYCYDQNLNFALDKSNQELYYDRNRIRLELIPLLEKNYNEKVEEALGRTAELLRWDEEFIASQVDIVWSKYCYREDDGCLKISLDAWTQPEAILSRLLRRAAAALTGEPRGLEYKYIKIMMKEGSKKGWKQDLPGIKVENVRNGFLFFRRELEQEIFEKIAGKKKKTAEWAEICLQPDQWYDLPDLELKVGIFKEFQPEANILWTTAIDEERLKRSGKPLTCRMRRPGDKVYFARIGHKALKKVFQEKGISQDKRQSIPVFANGDLLIWVPGVCRSDYLLPTSLQSPVLYGLVAKY